jgi:hypothetical protein
MLSFVIVIFLFLLPLSLSDILLGNTNVFVGVLIVFQLVLTRWDNARSRFCQGLLLALACWVKPNICLVSLCMTVFALSRKQYEYLYGMFCGGITPFLASLLAPNISLDTYSVFFSRVMRVTEHVGDGFSGNLSLIHYLDYYPEKLYKFWLASAALLVAGFTLMIKGDNIVKYEAVAFALTYSCWTLFWWHYLIHFVIVIWIYMISQHRTSTLYFATVYLLILSWMTIARYDPVGVNVLLVGFAVYEIVRRIRISVEIQFTVDAPTQA